MININTDKNKIKEVLHRGVASSFVLKSLEEKLSSGKQLIIKHGVDPTTADLHIGYAVIYEKLRLLQEMGHKIIFLIGDFTGRFGDPTEETDTRKLRNKKEIEGNVKSFIKQIGKILDIKKLEIRRNSEWFDKMSGEDMLRLASNFTVAQMLDRDMFQKRIEEEKEIYYHEPFYPMLQAYDSLMLKSDITVIGSDQIFNEIQGRRLQERGGQSPQDIIAMKLLVGLDGKKKMSQSLRNDIGITESPSEQYGKVMSLPDDVIVHYFELATRVPLDDVKNIDKELKDKKTNPRDIKIRLAKEIVSMYYGEKEAEKAEKEFSRIFREDKNPIDIPEVKLKSGKYHPLDLLFKLKLVVSKAEAKRLIEQRGVEIGGMILKNWKNEVVINSGVVIRVGKRRFIRIE